MSAPRIYFEVHRYKIGEVRCLLHQTVVLQGIAPDAFDPDAKVIAVRSLVAGLRRAADELEATIQEYEP